MPERRIILAGIDEAGYGPLLGPLCVGLSVLSVPAKETLLASDLDLWHVLQAGVTRERPRPKDACKGDAKGRVAIVDSKQLRLASDSASAHPLVHLERGVLSALMVRAGNEGPLAIENDAALLRTLGADVPAQPWYAQAPPTRLPLALSGPQLAIASNVLGNALRTAIVRIEHVGCDVVDEARFNALARLGGKGATTWDAVSRHARLVWEEFAEVESEGAERVGRTSLACDRLGGRVQYADKLRGLFAGTQVHTLEESDTRSRYVVQGEGRRMGVSFLVEGERQHLTIALSSMVAKLCRELMMARLNAWWETRARTKGVELKPTAGYALDGQRWLRDARAIATKAELEELTRIA
jgi:hypothetical protein